LRECTLASPRAWQGTTDAVEDEVVKIFFSELSELLL
jgi:hypothetical protein